MARHVVLVQQLRIVLVDSITEIEAEDADAVVVSGSHGGISAARFASEVPARLYVFNDAGVGKDGAGMSGLRLLEDAGVAACVVAHTSARIGEARDTWDNGVISAVNANAAALGYEPGQPIKTVVSPQNERPFRRP